MSIQNINSTRETTTTSPLNPSSELDRDAFLKLFLEQLKQQDPTAPMDTAQMMDQTATLSQIESTTYMKDAMLDIQTTMANFQTTNQSMVDAQSKLIEAITGLQTGMEQTGNVNATLAALMAYNTTSMIGKDVVSDFTALNITNNDPVKFTLYFKEPIDASSAGSKVSITDKDGKLVHEIDLSAKDSAGNYLYDGKKGYIEFEWNSKDTTGALVSKGAYTVDAQFNFDSTSNKYATTKLGSGVVESMMVIGGIPYLKLGSMNIPVGNIFEVKNA